MTRGLLTLTAILVLPAILLAQSELLAALSTNTAGAQDSIVSSLATGAISLPGPRAALAAMPVERRASMVRDAIALARAFTATPEFAQRYAIYRASQRPAAPNVPQTGEQARREQQRQIEIAVKTAQESAAKLPEDARLQLEDEIARMQRQVAALNADPEYRAAVDASARAAAKEAMADFQSKIAAFEQQYPSNPRLLIARRLRAFLDVCREVDFEARLAQGADGKYRFVDPALEGKPSEWKMCFRAGRPAVETARAAASEWLDTLVQEERQKPHGKVER